MGLSLMFQQHLDFPEAVRLAAQMEGVVLPKFTQKSQEERSVEDVLLAVLEEAKDKVMMGAERRSQVMCEKEKKNTAYHEAGHALVACCIKEADPVHKATIIQHGRALGMVMRLAESEISRS